MPSASRAQTIVVPASASLCSDLGHSIGRRLPANRLTCGCADSVRSCRGSAQGNAGENNKRNPAEMARFGPFEFDAARRQVTRDGCDVHLTPKAFDLLGVLIEAAPRVVPKAELHEEAVADELRLGRDARRTREGTAPCARRSRSRRSADPYRTANRLRVFPRDRRSTVSCVIRLALDLGRRAPRSLMRARTRSAVIRRRPSGSISRACRATTRGSS